MRCIFFTLSAWIKSQQSTPCLTTIWKVNKDQIVYILYLPCFVILFGFFCFPCSMIRTFLPVSSSKVAFDLTILRHPTDVYTGTTFVICPAVSIYTSRHFIHRNIFKNTIQFQLSAYVRIYIIISLKYYV